MNNSTIQDLGLKKLLVIPFIVYGLRGIAVLLFLNEQGGLTIILPEDGGLPPNVDYFFSTTIFVVTVAMLASTMYLFNQSGIGNYAMKGLVIMFFFIGQFVAWDVVIEIIIYERTILGYIEAVFIDYSPVIFIPLFMGWTMQKEFAKKNT
ncbi:hypothetical protein JCM19233_6953 [Vibrio astriarenae]|nr:hypothetical protein JCM19233_6953 [Vibrio sp. C7]